MVQNIWPCLNLILYGDDEVGTWVMHFDAEADGAEEEVAGMRRFGAISRLY